MGAYMPFQSSSLGMPPRVTPRNIQEVQDQSLGMPWASPSSSIKSSGLSRHFVFIVSCTVVLFLERLSFRLLCLVCLVCLNKVVWTLVLAVLFQISRLVLERSRKFHALMVQKGACFDRGLDFIMSC